MDRYLQHVTQKPQSVVFSQRTWQPALDIYETEDAVVAMVDLAGVSDKEIELVVMRNSLTLRGERRPPGEPGERRYSILEIPFGPFERSTPLPSPVDPDATTASYRQGFLEIIMPKHTPSGPQHVAVQTG
jgi:HSP20 family protein